MASQEEPNKIDTAETHSADEADDSSAPAERTPDGARFTRKKLIQTTPIGELLDVGLLQKLQDWLAATNRVSVIIRDPQGRPVTQPSYQNQFCRMVMDSSYGELSCRVSNRKAVKRAAREHRVVKYVCHAGLTQFAAPIEVEGVCVGTIVMGDRPEGRVPPDQIAALSRKIGLPEESLNEAMQRTKRWSEEEMTHAVAFLLSIANAVAALCYQGAELRAKLDQISSLYEVSKMLAGTLNLQKVLNLVAQSATDLTRAKGCSIRLLDKRGRNLVVKSFYNLSRRYLDKGPVLVSKSPIDKAALRGKLVQMPDMIHDPRVLYPKEAEREGIRSGVSVGLISKDRPIGTLHLYAAEPRHFDETEEPFIRSLANQAAVAIENAQLYHESLEKRRMDRELRVAGEIQERLLPERPPVVPGFDIAAAGVPCSDVGGDFYDFITLPDDRLAIVIADVAGKGVPGALLMASARAGLRAHLESTSEPREVARRLNLNLYHDTRAGQFVSLFFGVLDPTQHTFTYTNAGHNPPLLVRSGESVELHEGGLVLGAEETEVYEQAEVSLDAGNVIFFYTDGVTEALNAEETVFGIERLNETIAGAPVSHADELVERIRSAVSEFAGKTPQSDDITLIALKVE